MKRVSYLLAILMVISLIGCGAKLEKVTPSSKEPTSSEATSKQSEENKVSSEVSSELSSAVSEAVTSTAFSKDEENSNVSSTVKTESASQTQQKSTSLSIENSNRNLRNTVILDEKNVYYHSYDSIYAIKRTNGEQRLVYNAGEYVKSFTTDGTHLYFTTPTGLYRLSNDGGDLKLLSDDDILLSHFRLFYENNILFASNLGYDECVKISIKDDSANVLKGLHPSPVQENWSYAKEVNSDGSEVNFYRISPGTNQRMLIKTFHFKEPLISNAIIAMYTENYVIFYDVEKSNRDYVNEQIRKGNIIEYDHYYSIYDPNKNLEKRLSVADKTNYVDFANYDKEWLYFFEGLKIYRTKYDGSQKQQVAKFHQGITPISLVDGWIYFFDGRRMKADGSDTVEKLIGYE